MAKVLIVDDNLDQIESLAKVLNAKGHDVVTSSNGRDALNKVIGNAPDVVLLDLLMPEMDVASFLEVVRSYVRLQALPVVVLTGISDSPSADSARARKVNAILAKGKATTEDIENAIVDAIAKLRR